jgi:hypothetical protein
MHLSPRCATSSEPPCPREAARPSSIELYGRPWWSVHRGPRPALVHEPWTQSMLFPLKNKSQPKIQSSFAKRPLSFFVIKPQSLNFQEDPLIFKNNSRYSPSHFQKLQKGPHKIFLPYIRNCNFLFHLTHPLTHVFCILIDCVLTIR